MNRKRVFYIVLSLAVSVSLMGLLLSRVRTADFIRTLRDIHLPFLGLFAVFSLSNSVLRAVRYRWLLTPRPIGFGSIFLVTLIRNLFVDLLPARIGALSYIYVLVRRLDFPFQAAASTFLASFVLDFLTLSPFLIVAILTVGLDASPVSSPTMLTVSAAFFILSLALLRRMPEILRFCGIVLGVICHRLGWADRQWARVGLQKLDRTSDCLREIRKRRIDVPLFGLSLAIRAAKYASLYFLLAALMRSHGLLIRQLSLWKTILGITGAEMTSILPIKGLGDFGTWESAWALTFQLLHFDPRLSVISGLGVHLITNLFEYSLGISAMLFLALTLVRKHRNGRS